MKEKYYTEFEFDNTQNFIEVGYNIAYYRKHAGMTQEQLAEKVGISRAHLGAIEAPNLCRPISLDLLFNFATVLEIDAYQLLVFRKVFEAKSSSSNVPNQEM